MPLGRSRRFASLRAFLAGTGTELIHIMRRFETLSCACSRPVAVAAWASAIPARPVSSPLWVGEGRQCEQLGAGAPPRRFASYSQNFISLTLFPRAKLG